MSDNRSTDKESRHSLSCLSSPPLKPNLTNSSIRKQSDSRASAHGSFGNWIFILESWHEYQSSRNHDSGASFPHTSKSDSNRGVAVPTVSCSASNEALRLQPRRSMLVPCARQAHIVYVPVVYAKVMEVLLPAS